jgi:hypothetical protein
MSDEDIWKRKDIRSARMNALNNATRLICSLLEAGHFKNQTITTDLMFGKVTQLEQRYFDEIYKGMEPEGSVQNVIPSDTPPHSCNKCGKDVSDDVIKWCKDHAEKYGGKTLCRECQGKA